MKPEETFEIRAPRLRLLPWRVEDREGFRRLATNPVVVRYINDGTPYDEARVEEFLTRQMRQQRDFGYSMWRIAINGPDEVGGICGLQPLAETGEPEIGWWLAPEHWGKGLATEAASAAMRWGFTEKNFQKIVAVAIAGNEKSLAIMRRLGMRPDGEMLHRGIPCVRYMIRREDWLRTASSE